MDKLDGAAVVLPGVEVRVVQRCTSTNDLLLKENDTVLVAAEEQTEGRGRRGRRWHSAPGAGLTFSLGRRIRRPAREVFLAPRHEYTRALFAAAPGRSFAFGG
jgi:biotin-(acetyl-CoA carboxylase) ligase